MIYKFCSNCGARLESTQSLEPQHCTSCGTYHYHNSKPCAGALVIQDGNVLLVKRKVEPFKGWWDIPGGFLEAGEHPEDGAKREVREETGLDVRLTRLHGIYMDTYGDSNSHTLNIYYLAEPISGVPRAGSDAVDYQWFALSELPEQIAFRHARRVLADWVLQVQPI